MLAVSPHINVLISQKTREFVNELKKTLDCDARFEDTLSINLQQNLCAIGLWVGCMAKFTLKMQIVCGEKDIMEFEACECKIIDACEETLIDACPLIKASIK
jgi:hypothetical protein